MTKEIFERVQRKLANRRRTRTKPRRFWTLIGGGLGRCGHCGGLLKSHGHYKTKGDERGRPHTYHCGRRANGFPCPSGQVNADDLHRLMIEAYKEAWLGEEGQQILREQLLAQIKRRSDKPAAGDEKRLRAQIAALEKKIEKGTERLVIVDAADVPAVSKLLADWRTERDTFQALLRSPQSDSKGKPVGSPEQIVERALKALGELERRFHVQDVLTAREAFRQAFESATIWWRSRQEPGKRIAFDVCRAVIVLRAPISCLLDSSAERVDYIFA